MTQKGLAGKNRIRFGIISFAHMHAASYARALSEIPGAELVGIYDDNANRGLSVAAMHNTDYYDSLSDLLDADIHAVIVCSENVKHRDEVIQAAKAGKHILCEKPIATTSEDAIAMIEECEREGVILATAFPVRHAPPVLRTKGLIDSGAIGQVIAVCTTNHGRMPGGWFIDRKLSGGGAVLDHTVHVADLLRWFLNDEVKTVYAEVDTRMHDIDIDDCGMLLMEFRNGVFATLDPSWSRPTAYPTWGDVTMEIVGTEGVISLDVFAQVLVEANDSGPKVLLRNWGDNMDLLLVQDFVYAIRQGQKPAACGFDGLKALEVAIAAYESAAKGRPVQLNLGQSH
jgi:UDP-N-acetylglucosamine 3-dehydrogenase